MIKKFIRKFIIFKTILLFRYMLVKLTRFKASSNYKNLIFYNKNQIGILLSKIYYL
jgi:hypothetical protein